MSDVRIVRETDAQSVTIPNATDVSGRFDVGRFVKGSVLIPTGFTGNAITYEVGLGDAVFTPLNKNDGSAFGTVDVSGIKGEWLPFPIELFSHLYARIKSGASEGAERTLKVCQSG